MSFSYQVGYHEAGHAFAYWHLGFPLHGVQVISERNLARRKWLISKDGKPLTDKTGVCETEHNFFDTKRIQASNGAGKIRELCALQVFVSAAGPINTTFYTGLPLTQSFSSSGLDDLEKINMCCAFAGIGKKYKERLIARSIAILHSSPAREAMRGLANRLSKDGYLAGDRIASICRNVPGARRVAFRFSN